MVPEVEQYPAIPDPTIDPLSIQQAIQRLKEGYELLTGQRGPKKYSFPEGMLELRKQIAIGDNVVSGRIMDLNELVVTANGALAQRTTILEAEMTYARGDQPSLLARITQVDTARVNGDSALAVRATNLETEIRNAAGSGNTLQAKFTQVDQARVDGDTALSGTVSNLNATLFGAGGTIPTINASIIDEQTARVGGDSANADAITTLNATLFGAGGTVPTINANITNEQTARVNGDSANANAINTLTTTVNGHTSSISTHQSSIDGISVRYGVQGSINGTTGGFVFAGIRRLDGTVTYDLEINANVAIRGNLVIDGTLTGPKIGNDQLDNRTLEIGAVTMTAWGAAGGDKTVNATAYGTSKLLITVNSIGNRPAGGASSVMQLYVNGVAVDDRAIQFFRYDQGNEAGTVLTNTLPVTLLYQHSVPGLRTNLYTIPVRATAGDGSLVQIMVMRSAA